jgi:hypothetical protein
MKNTVSNQVILLMGEANGIDHECALGTVGRLTKRSRCNTTAFDELSLLGYTSTATLLQTQRSSCFHTRLASSQGASCPSVAVQKLATNDNQKRNNGK